MSAFKKKVHKSQFCPEAKQMEPQKIQNDIKNMQSTSLVKGWRGQ